MDEFSSSLLSLSRRKSTSLLPSPTSHYWLFPQWLLAPCAVQVLLQSKRQIFSNGLGTSHFYFYVSTALSTRDSSRNTNKLLRRSNTLLFLTRQGHDCLPEMEHTRSTPLSPRAYFFIFKREVCFYRPHPETSVMGMKRMEWDSPRQTRFWTKTASVVMWIHHCFYSFVNVLFSIY